MIKTSLKDIADGKSIKESSTQIFKSVKSVNEFDDYEETIDESVNQLIFDHIKG